MQHKRKNNIKEYVKSKFNNTIEILNDSITYTTPINCKCKKCSHEWTTTFASLRQSTYGCPKCAFNSIRITNAEFLERLYKIHGNKYDPLEPYIKQTERIKLFCNQCYNTFYISPSKIFIGQGCPHCARKKHNINFTKVDANDFAQNVKEKFNDQIILLTKYINSNTKVKCKCRTCDYEFEILPGHLLIGKGCKKCYFKNQTKTNEQFLKELQQIHGDNIIPLEEYQKANIKIKCKCKQCNHEWKIKPRKLLIGEGCPLCANKRIGAIRKKSNEQFLNELRQVYNDTITLLTPYTRNKTVLKCKCTICNYEWEVLPYSLLKGKGCPNCCKIQNRNKLAKSNEQFLNELYSIHDNNIQPLEPYITAVTKIKCKCNICEHIWLISPASLLRGNGCPICKLSKGERYIHQFLKNNHFIFTIQFKIANCKNIKPLPFDFAIFKTLDDKKNKKPWILIEYDGIQHWDIFRFSKNQTKELQDLKNRQRRDSIKTNYCINNQIPLIRIAYKKEYKDMDKIAQQLIFKELETQLKQIFIQQIIDLIQTNK